jgi:hypothetical protein
MSILSIGAEIMMIVLVAVLGLLLLLVSVSLAIVRVRCTPSKVVQYKEEESHSLCLADIARKVLNILWR